MTEKVETKTESGVVILTDEQGRQSRTYEAFGTRLTIHDGGEFEDQRTRELKSYDPSIKIDTGRDGLKLTALQLAVILEAMKCPEIAEEFARRKKEEVDDQRKKMQALLK